MTSLNPATVAEVTVQTSSAIGGARERRGADQRRAARRRQQSSGARSTVRGSAKALQSDNVDDELRARGVTSTPIPAQAVRRGRRAGRSHSAGQDLVLRQPTVVGDVRLLPRQLLQRDARDLVLHAGPEPARLRRQHATGSRGSRDVAGDMQGQDGRHVRERVELQLPGLYALGATSGRRKRPSTPSTTRIGRPSDVDPAGDQPSPAGGWETSIVNGTTQRRAVRRLRRGSVRARLVEELQLRLAVIWPWPERRPGLPARFDRRTRSSPSRT